MSLILKIIAPTPLPNGQAGEFTFDKVDGTIGRKPANDFVLIDPERFISSQHAEIVFENDQYFITDTSTNGVFINNSQRAIGTGSRTALKDGDNISIGEFQLVANIAVEVKEVEKTAWQPTATPAPGLNEFTFSEPLINDNKSADSVDPLDFIGNPSPIGNPNTGNEFSDIKLDGPAFDINTSNGFAEEALPNPHENIPQPLQINEPFSPPSAIPENWDFMAEDLATNGSPLTDSATSIVTPTKAPNERSNSSVIPETENFLEDDIFAAISSPVESPMNGSQTAPQNIMPTPTNNDRNSMVDNNDHHATGNNAVKNLSTDNNALQNGLNQSDNISNLQQSFNSSTPTAPPIGATPHSAQAPSNNSAGNTASTDELLNAFFEGAGINRTHLNAGDSVELMKRVGEMSRISIEGLMIALRARATIKSSFRVNKTMIASVENNPLKFSVTAEEAVNIILAMNKPGYMSSQEALNEGFKDLQTHQMAMMAGIQAIIVAITEQFDPNNLSRQFEAQQPTKNFLSGNKKAKYWDQYQAFYTRISDNLQDDFQNIYGEEFAKAYEEQIRKLI